MIQWALFGALATVVVVSAAGVVLARNAVHAALLLVLTLFGVAGLFVLQQAHFLAAVQVIVYAGAIVVLFLFVIMLLGVDREELLDEPLRGQRPAAVLVGVGLLAELVLLARILTPTGDRSVRGTVGQGNGNVSRLAESLFTDFLFPFEVTSLLLVIAVVGGIVLARRSVGERSGPPAVGRADPGDGTPDAAEVAPLGGGPPGPREDG